MGFARNFLVALTPLLLGNVAMAEGYTFTSGAEYTSGDYDTGIDTSTWYIPFTVGYAADTYAWSVTVPFVRIDGSSLVTGVSSSTVHGPGGMKTQTTSTTTNVDRVDSGLGDITLSASLQLQKETPAKPWLAVTGKIKLGTADEDKFLGTGETDYAVQLEAAKGPIDGFIGYNFLGDTETVDYDNILYGAGAVTIPLQQQWRVRTELYLEQSPLSGIDPVSELTVSLAKPFPQDRSLNLYAIKGLSDSSPDWGLGLLVSKGF